MWKRIKPLYLPMRKWYLILGFLGLGFAAPGWYKYLAEGQVKITKSAWGYARDHRDAEKDFVFGLLFFTLGGAGCILIAMKAPFIPVPTAAEERRELEERHQQSDKSS